MKNIKKAVVLLLSVMVIIAATNVTLASTIQPRNTTEDEDVEDISDTENEVTNIQNTANVVGNTASNLSTNTNIIAGNVSTINSTNTTQNIPKTGVEDTYLNFALFLLLAVVLGMFSLVQYNKIVKKED